MPRSRWLLGFAGAVTSLKLVAFLWLLNSNPDAFWQRDSAGYLDPAVALIESGRFLSDGGPELLRTPGYPLFLAGVIILFANPLAAVPIQILMGTAIAFLVYQFVMRREQNDLSPSAPALAFSIVLLDPNFTISQYHMMSEVLFTLILTLSLYFLARHVRSARVVTLATGTLLLAVAAYVRPISLYLGYILVLLLAFRASRTKQWTRALVILVAGLLTYQLTITAWVIRNYKVAGTATFSTVSAVNLYEYLGAATKSRAEGESWESVRRQFRGTLDTIAPTEAERMRLARKRGVGILVEHPLEAALVVAQGLVPVLFDPGTGQIANMLALRPTKTGLIYKFYDMSPLEFAMYLLERERALVILLAFGSLWTFAIWGLATRGAWEQRKCGSLFDILMLICAAYLLVLAAGPNGVARFRAPVTPILAYFAAIGLKTGSWRKGIGSR